MNKIKYLDGLRGLAALMVVVHHLVIAFYPATFSADNSQTHFQDGKLEIWYCHSPFSVFTNGNFAVYIFFVLSGFVLSQKYFRTNDSSLLISSAVKRYFRLFIPVFFTVTIAFIFLKLNLFYNVPASHISKSEWWLGIFWQFNPDINDWIYNSFIEVFYYGNSKYNTVYWTMSIELFGSMMVFALLALTHNLRNRWIIYPLFLFLFIKTESFFYASFVVGIFLSNYYPQLIEFGKKKWSIPVKIILLAVGILFGGFFSGQDITGTIYEKLIVKFVIHSWDSFHFYGSAFLVCGIILSPVLNKILSMKPISFLGKLSFSLYLLHPIVIGSFSSWLLLQLDYQHNYNQSMMILLPLSLVIIFISSWLMSNTIDKMSLTLPGKFYEKIFKPFNSEIK